MVCACPPCPLHFSSPARAVVLGNQRWASPPFFLFPCLDAGIILGVFLQLGLDSTITFFCGEEISMHATFFWLYSHTLTGLCPKRLSSSSITTLKLPGVWFPRKLVSYALRQKTTSPAGNRAHTILFGEDNSPMRQKLHRISTVNEANPHVRSIPTCTYIAYRKNLGRVLET